MSSIPNVSLTDLNRSASSLQAALEDHPLALLTRYHKPAYAVMPLAVAHQLLQIAEQAARLRQQPDVLQLSEILLTIRRLPLQLSRSARQTVPDLLRSLLMDLLAMIGEHHQLQR